MMAAASTPPPAVNATANSSLPMRPHTASAGNASLQPRGHRHDQLVAAEHAELRVDVGHAVELDQREAGHVVAGALSHSEVEQFERLGVVRQAGELVLVGGAPRLLLARRQFTPRAPQLRQRNSGEAHQRDGDGGDERHQPLHRLHHRMGFLPGQEAGDAALRVHHRLHLALARARIGFEFEVLEADALLDHAHEARIDRVGFSEQIAEFADRVAQRGALLRPQPLVALPRHFVADDAGEQGRAHGKHREHDDQLRGRQHAFGARARRAARAPAFEPRKQRAAGACARRYGYDLAVHRLLPALRCGIPKRR